MNNNLTDLKIKNDLKFFKYMALLLFIFGISMLMLSTSVKAQNEVVISSANTSIYTNSTNGDLVQTFLPEFIFQPIFLTDYYYGVNVNSSLDVLNVSWKIIVNSTTTITPFDLELEEVGWYDPWECSIREADNPPDYPNCTNSGTETYNFIGINSTTIEAIGSSNWSINVGDIFNNVDRIKVLNTSLPGNYTIIRVLIDADTGDSISNEFVQIFQIPLPSPPPEEEQPTPTPPSRGYVPPLTMEIIGIDSLVIHPGETKTFSLTISTSRLAEGVLTIEGIQAKDLPTAITQFIKWTPNNTVYILKGEPQEFNITITIPENIPSQNVGVKFVFLSGYRMFNKTITFSITPDVIPAPALPKSDDRWKIVLMAVVFALIVVGLYYLLFKHNKSKK